MVRVLTFFNTFYMKKNNNFKLGRSFETFFLFRILFKDLPNGAPEYTGNTSINGHPNTKAIIFFSLKHKNTKSNFFNCCLNVIKILDQQFDPILHIFSRTI